MSRQLFDRLGEIYTVYNDEKLKAEKTFRKKSRYKNLTPLFDRLGEIYTVFND